MVQAGWEEIHNMLTKNIYGAISCVVAVAGIASGAIVEVHVGSFYFTPQFADVQPGDTVRWIHDGGTHDVTSGAFCGNDTGLFFSDITETTPTFEWTVPAEYDGDVIPYYCSVGNHCVASDQYGALLVNVEAHFLTTNGFVFEPAAVSVDAGDAVFWIHAGGSHTVTSGTSCSPDGRFNEVLDNLSQMPYYVVPVDEPTGVIDYYCTPHCGSGMAGAIDVTGGSVPCPEDLDGDGQIGVDDLLQLLSVYGSTCTGCPEDIDGNGVIGVDDLLQLLSVYGSAC